MTIKATQFLRTDNTKKRIVSVRFIREPDDYPDLSWLGTYSDSPAAHHIDRGESKHGEYRYFNASSNYEGEKPKDIVKYMQQDYARMEAYNACEWCMMFVKAKAVIYVEGVKQTITSGGLGGVESDSDESYFAEIREEQLSELGGILRKLGFTAQAVKTAIESCNDT